MKGMMSVHIRLVMGVAFIAVTGSSGYAQGPVGGGMGGQCSVLLQNNTDRPLSFEVSNDQITWIKMTATNGLGADVCLAKEANQRTGDISSGLQLLTLRQLGRRSLRPISFCLTPDMSSCGTNPSTCGIFP